MTLDGGLGGIVSGQKDVHAVNDTLFQGWITACKHANGRDWWLVVHKWYSDLFYKFLITPTGVSSPISQNIGQVMMPSDGLRDFDIRGQASFSPDGSQYAMAGQSNILHLFDFDRCSGMFSNPRIANIDTTDRVRSLSFSPNSRYIYISHLQYRIFQFDTWQTNLNSASITVALWDSFIDPTSGLQVLFHNHQLASNGKIYISTFNSSKYFHVINSPNDPGLTCNIMQHAFDISNYNVTIPNFPNYNLGSQSGSPCDSLTSLNESILNTPLQLRAFPNPFNSAYISINYSLEQNKTGNLEIINTTGQIIYQQTLPQWSSHQKLHLAEISDGIYLMKLQSGAKNVTLKIIKTGD